jgi:hypothetical protein
MKTSIPNTPRVRRPGLAVFGAACLLIGVAGLGGLLVTDYAGTPATDAWAIRFGLAGILVLSALAQILAMVGAWALWSALRRRP